MSRAEQDAFWSQIENMLDENDRIINEARQAIGAALDCVDEDGNYLP